MYNKKSALLVPLNWFDPNDIRGNTTTDKEGHFQVSGAEEEDNGIEPFISIDHTCNATKKVIRKELPC